MAGAPFPHPDGCSYAPDAGDLSGLRFIRRLLGWSSVGSTNTLALRMAAAGKAETGTLLLADRQEAGRGRGEHVWHSPAGTGIYATLLAEPLAEPARTPFVTLAVGLAVHRALDGLCGFGKSLDIKWPNDLLLDGAKLCGILVESTLVGDRLGPLAVGFGINVGHVAFPPDVGRRAISLVLATGREWDRRDVLLAVLRELDRTLGILHAGGFDEIGADWCARSAFVRGRSVRFFEDGVERRGVTSGLAPDGALLVEESEGRLRPVHGGELFETEQESQE